MFDTSRCTGISADPETGGVTGPYLEQNGDSNSTLHHRFTSPKKQKQQQQTNSASDNADSTADADDGHTVSGNTHAGVLGRPSATVTNAPETTATGTMTPMQLFDDAEQTSTVQGVGTLAETSGVNSMTTKAVTTSGTTSHAHVADQSDAKAADNGVAAGTFPSVVTGTPGDEAEAFDAEKLIQHFRQLPFFKVRL